MSFDFSAIKSAVFVGIVAVVLTLAVNLGYGLAFLPWRRMSLPEAQHQVGIGAPYLVLGLFLAAAGAILGDRLAASKSPRRRWIGLVAGAGLAMVVVAVAWLQDRLDFWLPPNAFMAVVGGWLGEWLAGRG